MSRVLHARYITAVVLGFVFSAHPLAAGETNAYVDEIAAVFDSADLVVLAQALNIVELNDQNWWNGTLRVKRLVTTFRAKLILKGSLQTTDSTFQVVHYRLIGKPPPRSKFPVFSHFWTRPIHVEMQIEGRRISAWGQPEYLLFLRRSTPEDNAYEPAMGQDRTDLSCFEIFPRLMLLSDGRVDRLGTSADNGQKALSKPNTTNETNSSISP